MRPFITLWNVVVYMTWVWIVVWFSTFIIVVFAYCRKLGISFKDFFYSLPILVALLYVVWAYSFLIIENGIFIPTWLEFIETFTPYWYSFHFAWLVIWFIIYMTLFLKNIKNPATRKKRIDTFFYALALSFIPLWVFLTLGDDFIWVSTKSIIWIQSFTEQSKLSKYSKVIPVWLLISFAWIFTYIFVEILKKRYKKKWIWFLWFWILSFLLSIVFIFQQYPKHWVAKFFWLTVDIKHYIARIITIICIYIYLYSNKRKQQTNI